MIKVLVTGANGYIGSKVVEQLLQNEEVFVIAVDFQTPIPHSRMEYKCIDILADANSNSLYADLGYPDACIHLAWRNGFAHNADSHLEDLPFHYQFLKNLVDQGCKNISVMGSMHEVGYFEGKIDEKTPCNPMSLYGIAKNSLRQAMMAYCEGKEVALKWLRAFYITGNDARNQSIFTKILQFEKEGKVSFPFTDGKSRYDFIDVNELALQIASATIQMEVQGCINVCSGKAISLKDKVEEFLVVNNLKIRPEYGVFPSRKYDSPEIYGCNEKIVQILNNKNNGYQ